jgi:hypothetical protein
LITYVSCCTSTTLIEGAAIDKGKDETEADVDDGAREDDFVVALTDEVLLVTNVGDEVLSVADVIVKALIVDEFEFEAVEGINRASDVGLFGFLDLVLFGTKK